MACGVVGVQLRAGHERHARLRREVLGLHLQRHRLDLLRRRPDPGQPGVGDRLRELRVLGQEAVAGVDRVGAGAPRGVQDLVGVAGRTRRWSGPAARTARSALRGARRRVGVGVGVARATVSMPIALAPCGAIRDRDLAAVGDQATSCRSRPHIRQTPKPDGAASPGPEWMADSARPSTSRVSRGSMMPSSHSRPVANSAVDSPSTCCSKAVAHRRERRVVERAAQRPRPSAGPRSPARRPSCLGPITAMRWLGQVKTNRGSYARPAMP